MPPQSYNAKSSLKLIVRRATLRDLDSLVHQRRAMWKDLGIKGESLHQRGDQAYRRWAQARLRSGKLVAWVVENRAGRVAGGGSLWLQPVQPRPHRTAMFQPYLLSMFTEPEFRRRGVATLVVQTAIDWCKKNRYERLMLHASEMGRKVYTNFGFKRTMEMRLDLTKNKPLRITRTR